MESMDYSKGVLSDLFSDVSQDLGEVPLGAGEVELSDSEKCVPEYFRILMRSILGSLPVLGRVLEGNQIEIDIENYSAVHNEAVTASGVDMNDVSTLQALVMFLEHTIVMQWITERHRYESAVREMEKNNPKVRGIRSIRDR